MLMQITMLVNECRLWGDNARRKQNLFSFCRCAICGGLAWAGQRAIDKLAYVIVSPIMSIDSNPAGGR